MDAAMYATIQSMTSKPTFIQALKGLVLNPWDAFLGKPGWLNIKFGASSFLSPALLLFLPIFLLIKEKGEKYIVLALLLAAMFVCWNFTFPFTRFLYPAVVILVLLAAYAFEKLQMEAPKIVKYFAGALFILYASFGILLGFFQVNLWEGTFGLSHLNESDEEYMARQLASKRGFMLSSYQVFKYINENLDAGTHILIIGDAQHLYIKKRHEYSYLSASDPCNIFKQDEKKILESLQSRGINYIVYNPRELRRLQQSKAISFKEEDDHFIEDFLKSPRVELVYFSDAQKFPVFLYKIL